jgi:hypothetical protein
MDRNHLAFDFAAAACVYNRKSGKAATIIGKAVNTNLPDAPRASMRASGIDVKNALELGPGQYAIRIVIGDNVTGKIGSVTAPLTVD